VSVLCGLKVSAEFLNSVNTPILW